MNRRISKLFGAAVLAMALMNGAGVASAQVVSLGEEDLYGPGARMVFGYSQHIPGGQGVMGEVGFDFADASIAEGVRIIPSIAASVSYNIDIDDPAVRHLIIGGITPQVRIGLDLTQPGWVTRVEAIAWVGVTLNGCLSISKVREDSNPREFADLEDGTGAQFCYGPAVGLDLAVGRNLYLTLGLDTLFFDIGTSGFQRAPFLMVGSKIGFGYKILF